MHIDHRVVAGNIVCIRPYASIFSPNKLFIEYIFIQRSKLHNDDDDAPPEDFRLIPVHPENQDLNDKQKHTFLRRNKGITTFSKYQVYFVVLIRSLE